MAEFFIGNRKIGPAEPPLVIAEIGINHGGDLETAKQMVKAAADAGAEIIKHQTHIVEDEMSGHAKAVIPGNADISIYEIMDDCALTPENEKALKDYTESLGVIFISTPFSRAAADFLETLDVAAYKIGSGECNNYPLVKHVAGFGKPIILSTGMNDISSIRPSVEIMRDAGVPFALLHCTNIYPTPPELVRLGGVQELKEAFPDAVVGLSDHTVGNYACLGAVAVGADILERHFTDTMEREGPDIVCSMDPEAMSDLIEGASVLQKARGGQKGLVQEEIVTADFAFASVVTIKPIQAGEVLTMENIWVKRPGTGEFKADDFEGLLGQKVTANIPADHQLRAQDVQ
ncbi:N-acetylneuraminate synthase family protein [Temperatibacter marinus]|uniref:N-acetylneuraminate synthase family protein n=1 Tax=Temperatibacter marinus TaxID=1456591 RepID=A0AA52HAB6_9PROT|nr:N-acetylneuraminate synthase family protein [Temperatibacter marinus]WND02570.1 N-acetylneuraminate synthase family protein [Temperatibacter marinus]